MGDERDVVVGLDVGTSGVRAVALDWRGELVAEGRAAFPSEATRVDGPKVEQQPDAWTQAVVDALRQLTARLPTACRVRGVSVDATSGTFLLVDAQNRPLTPGILYSDQRAADVADQAADALRSTLAPYGIRISSSFALAKLVHLARHEPRLFDQAARVVHQTDWVVGFLCGRYDVTDVSTALKTGVDPGTLEWPEAVERLGVPRRLLPEVVLPGTVVGEVTTAAEQQTGLPKGTPVVAGCTDGTAGCLASGARAAGDLNVTLGTTLVFKAVAERPLVDPDGVVYNHRHPAGGYLPGAASSTGGDWVEQYFPGADLKRLDEQAARVVPTGRVVYPLVKRGERFPFVRPDAVGFGLDEVSSDELRFAAGLEGVALLERLGVERLQQLGLAATDTVFATGGGVSSAVWLKIRAAVTGRCYSVPRHPECAVGAAVLAAAPRLGGCRNAIAQLVQAGVVVEPDRQWSRVYEEQYQRFVEALKERGYL